jgi:hypothetical protein
VELVCFGSDACIEDDRETAALIVEEESEICDMRLNILLEHEIRDNAGDRN